MFYYLIRKLLFLIDPEKAHILTLKYLNSQKIQLLKTLFIKPVISEKKTKCMGLTFNNKLGVAAGIDKNGEYINTLSNMGFGFIEVGTVTLLPQDGNQKPRLFRIIPMEGIINRMGFNNLGIDNLINNIKKSNFKGIIGINIGKNKNTNMRDSINDYLICIEKIYLYASYIVINISSPNTTNLRKLQYGFLFEKLLYSIKKNKKKCIKNILNILL